MNIQNLINEPLSNNALSQFIDERPNIVSYAEISTMTNINQIFKNNKNYAILFLATQSQNNGHWELIMQDTNNIYFFDSYGLKPCQMIDILPNKLGQNNNLLVLMNESPKNCYYSDKKYQLLENDSQTCGRYVTLCLYLFMYFNKTFTFDIFDFVLTSCKSVKHFPNYDVTIAFLINQRFLGI